MSYETKPNTSRCKSADIFVINSFRAKLRGLDRAVTLWELCFVASGSWVYPVARGIRLNGKVLD